jgi:26S proteasome regulatory subunit N10
MPLEAVMIVVDNSESSRNGDYAPTRFDAQADAVNIIFQNVVQGNPESSVGLMSMGGKGPEVLVTLTTDQGKILDGLHRTTKKIKGVPHLATGIQVAGVCPQCFPIYRPILLTLILSSSPSSTVRTEPNVNG